MKGMKVKKSLSKTTKKKLGTATGCTGLESTEQKQSGAVCFQQLLESRSFFDMLCYKDCYLCTYCEEVKKSIFNMK